MSKVPLYFESPLYVGVKDFKASFLGQVSWTRLPSLAPGLGSWARNPTGSVGFLGLYELHRDGVRASGVLRRGRDSVWGGQSAGRCDGLTGVTWLW